MANEQMAFDASVVGPGYHETLGIQMAQGRGFTDADREGVDTRQGARTVYVQPRAGAPMQHRTLPPVDDAVVDAGFDAWLRANWQPPAKPSLLDWILMLVDQERLDRYTTSGR